MERNGNKYEISCVITEDKIIPSDIFEHCNLPVLPQLNLDVLKTKRTPKKSETLLRTFISSNNFGVVVFKCLYIGGLSKQLRILILLKIET